MGKMRIQFVKPNGYISKNNYQFVIREGAFTIRYISGMRKIDRANIGVLVRDYSDQFTDLGFSTI